MMDQGCDKGAFGATVEEAARERCDDCHERYNGTREACSSTAFIDFFSFINLFAFDFLDLFENTKDLLNVLLFQRNLVKSTRYNGQHRPGPPKTPSAMQCSNAKCERDPHFTSRDADHHEILDRHPTTTSITVMTISSSVLSPPNTLLDCRCH